MKTPTFTQAIKAARFADDRMRRAALIGHRLKQGRGRARFTRVSKLTGVVWTRAPRRH